MSIIKRKIWPTKETILLLERLELYVSAGLSINEALKISAQGLTSKRISMLTRAVEIVESGGGVSRALESTVGLDGTSVGLISHGEQSGNLSGAFGFARELLERREDLRKKCLSAAAYPTIIGAFAALLTLGLMRGVMPQIIPMLLGLHVQLPILTRVVIFVSEWLTSYGLFALIALVIFGFAGAFAYRRNEKIRLNVQRIFMLVPQIGRMISDYHLSVFLHSCGSMISAGLPAARSFGDAVLTMTFLPIRRTLQSHILEAERGVPLGRLLMLKQFPPQVSALASAGEASGALGQSLLRAARIMDRDIDHNLRRLTALIEPAMMIVMGGAVGAIALSIMMPIYDISKAIQIR